MCYLQDWPSRMAVGLPQGVSRFDRMVVRLIRRISLFVVTPPTQTINFVC